MSWVRLWTDMPNDPKWRVISRHSKRPVSEVVSVFVYMLTDAAQWEHRGSLGNWNDEDVGAALDIETEHVEAIRLAMQGRVLDGDNLLGWSKRQPAREDNSAERAKAWREKKKQEVTLANACERTRTLGDAPEEKRIDKNIDTNVSNNIHTPTSHEILCEVLSDATAKDLIAHRLAKKSKLTPRAAKELVRAFKAFGDPEAAAAEMIMRGWVGFKSEWMQNNQRAGPPQPDPNRRGGLARLYREVCERENEIQAQVSDGNVLRLPSIYGGG
jgi:hypothetical protein